MFLREVIDQLVLTSVVLCIEKTQGKVSEWDVQSPVSLKMSSVLRGEPSTQLWSLKPRQECHCKRKESQG